MHYHGVVRVRRSLPATKGTRGRGRYLASKRFTSPFQVAKLSVEGFKQQEFVVDGPECLLCAHAHAPEATLDLRVEDGVLRSVRRNNGRQLI